MGQLKEARLHGLGEYNMCCTVSRIFTIRCMKCHSYFKCGAFAAQHVLRNVYPRAFEARILLTLLCLTPRLAAIKCRSRVRNACCTKYATPSRCNHWTLRCAVL